MEAIGLAVGIAGLFSTCMDVVEKVNIYKDFEANSSALGAVFRADKLYLEEWASKVGIKLAGWKAEIAATHHKDLDDSGKCQVIREILEAIPKLLVGDNDDIYHVKPFRDPHRSAAPTTKSSMLPATSSSFTVSRARKIKDTLTGKQEQMERRVRLFHDLVQSLYNTVALDPSSSSQFSTRLLDDMAEEHWRNRRLQMWQWLDYEHIPSFYDETNKKRLTGTCDWILHDDTFEKWSSFKHSSDQPKVLWIHGKAGFGKTVLGVRICEYLKASNSPAIIAYYSISSDMRSYADSNIVLRSWLFQIMQNDADAFEIAFSMLQGDESQKASRYQILELLSGVVKQLPSLTLIVDGLDECERGMADSFVANPVESLVGDIRLALAGTSTRILVLSRDTATIRRSLCANEHPRIDLSERKITVNDVKSDTKLFSDHVLGRKLPSRKIDDFREHLSQRISNRCDGMFLWIQCLENQLYGTTSKRRLEEVIDAYPTSLEEIYSKSWQKITNLSTEPLKDRALAILRWTVYSLRPLSVGELVEALLVETEGDRFGQLSMDEYPAEIDQEYIDEEIVSICHDLVEVRPHKATDALDYAGMTLHPTHPSAEEYIRRHLPPPLHTMERLPDQQSLQSEVLAEICLQYISIDTNWIDGATLPPEVKSTQTVRPGMLTFRDYAASSWHLHHSQGSQCSKFADLSQSFFHPDNISWHHWRRWYDRHHPLKNRARGDDTRPEEGEVRNVTILYYALCLGIKELVVHLVNEFNIDVNHGDHLGRTPLQTACARGSVALAEILLNKGAAVNAADKDKYTPLLRACMGSGRVSLVKTLVNHGADTHARCDLFGTPALHHSSRYGDIPTVEFLIREGVDINAQDNAGWTALHFAVWKGGSDACCADLVSLLCDHGADVLASTKSGWTAFTMASHLGKYELVKFFLKGPSKALLNAFAIDDIKATPLFLAAGEGHADIVRMLLENAAALEIPNINGVGPLYAACYAGHEETVQILLDNGASTETLDSAGNSPLHIACYYGKVEALDVLLKHGASMDILNYAGNSPLHDACYCGHEQIVKLLLRNGASTDITTIEGTQGKSPLYTASECGHANIVKCLLDHGCDARQYRDEYGRTMFLRMLSYHEIPVAEDVSSSAVPGHVEIAKLLLKTDHVDISVRDTKGRNAVFYAVEAQQGEILKDLLDDVRLKSSSVDLYGITPIHLAAALGYPDMTRILLSGGSLDINVRDICGRTAAWWTRRNGDEIHQRILSDAAVHRGVHLDVADHLPQAMEGAPKPIPSTSNVPRYYCDVCHRHFLRGSGSFHCTICNGGDFDICVECFAFGARCLEPSHVCVPG